jgi:hypothetical protein
MQNKFFVDRRTSKEYGDRIEFAVSLDRSLTISDATALRNILTSLIGDDQTAKINAHFNALRADLRNTKALLATVKFKTRE